MIPLKIPLRRLLIAAAAMGTSLAVAIYLIVTTEPPGSCVGFIAPLIPSLAGIACTVWLFRMTKTLRGLIVAILISGCTLAIIAQGIKQRFFG